MPLICLEDGRHFCAFAGFALLHDIFATVADVDSRLVGPVDAAALQVEAVVGGEAVGHGDDASGRLTDYDHLMERQDGGACCLELNGDVACFDGSLIDLERVAGSIPHIGLKVAVDLQVAFSSLGVGGKHIQRGGLACGNTLE